LIIPKDLNRLIGRAMHIYDMLDDGDHVLIAVSGGVDSLVLAAILKIWQKKAPIEYQLTAVHLDMGFPNSNSSAIRDQLAKISIPLELEQTNIGIEALTANHNHIGCFECARSRRNRLFALAREKNCNKLALGHHKDDIIETFFINVLYGGNISTMVPTQILFSGNLHVIRPLAFLEKYQVEHLAEHLKLKPVKNPCPHAGRTRRDDVRQFLTPLYQSSPQMKGTIFSALANVRHEYLLKKSK